MRLSLDIVQRAGDALATAGSFDRRRAALVGGLNVVAVALAFGALHLGGTIVEGAREQPRVAAQPSPEAVVAPAARVSAPIPHLAPALLAATPDAATLFAAPIVEPTAFVGGTTAVAADTPSALASSPALAAPSLAHGPVGPQSAVPAIQKVVKLGKAAVAAADTAVVTTGGSLVLTDAMLDANGSVGIPAGSGNGVAATATAGVGTAVAAATGAVGGVASSVSSAVSGVAAAVGGAVGSR